MIVVAIIGILSSVALPSMSRYVKKSRTVEAVTQLEKLWAGSVAYYQADHANAQTTIQDKQFPGGPSVVTECQAPCNWTTVCCAYPGEVCPGNSVVYRSSGPMYPWIELGFNLPSPHRYVPIYWSNLTSTFGVPDVQIEVRGNLDCDTTYSTFKLFGSPYRNPNNAASGNVEPYRLGPVHTVNELE